MDLKEVGWEVVHWFHLIQDRSQCGLLSISIKDVEFLDWLSVRSTCQEGLWSMEIVNSRSVKDYNFVILLCIVPSPVFTVIKFYSITKLVLWLQTQERIRKWWVVWRARESTNFICSCNLILWASLVCLRFT
jgi:hypothetical protein